MDGWRVIRCTNTYTHIKVVIENIIIFWWVQVHLLLIATINFNTASREREENNIKGKSLLWERGEGKWKNYFLMRIAWCEIEFTDGRIYHINFFWSFFKLFRLQISSQLNIILIFRSPEGGCSFCKHLTTKSSFT